MQGREHPERGHQAILRDASDEDEAAVTQTP